MKPPYPTDAWPRFGDEPPQERPLFGMSLGTVGLILLLASLGVFFLAALMAYFMLRFAGDAPPAVSLRLPWPLWVSTLVLVASAVTMHLAARASRRDDRRAMRRHILITGGLALAFLLVQGPALAALLAAHRDALGAHPATHGGLHGMAFVLVGLHAAHVLGGLIPLAWLTRRALRGRFTPVARAAVRGCAAYWHFLDAVWIVLVLTFVFTA